MSNVDRTRTHAAGSAVTAAEQQPEGWRFVPDTILPGYQWAPQWVPARTPTVHLGPISGKAVGGPNTVQHSSTVQKHGKHLVLTLNICFLLFLLFCINIFQNMVGTPWRPSFSFLFSIFFKKMLFIEFVFKIFFLLS